MKLCHRVRASPGSLWVPSGFAGIAGSKVGMWASTALLGAGLVMEGLETETEPDVRWGFVSVEWSSLLPIGSGDGAHGPGLEALSWLHSLSFAHCPQHWHFCLVENCARAGGQGRCPCRLREALRQSQNSWPEPQLGFSRRPSTIPSIDKPARVCSPLEEAWLSAVVQSPSRVFATPWTAACQVSWFFTSSRSAKTHLHRVSDAIQPPHPLLPTSPLALSLSQH